jgi:hypothetical protein
MEHQMETLREQLHREMEASAVALADAHAAHVNDAMDSVRWERRGLLQRLTRRPA